MAKIEVKNVKISGIAACVPSNIEENKSLSFFKEGEAEKVIASTGIERRHIADESTTTGDLCLKATEELISNLGWNKDEIDCLIFVSQTPDYKLPSTSCVLHGKLGLKIDCYCADISYGCPGWIYGLSVISSLLSHGSMKKGLLLVGDTPSKFKSSKDKTSWPLFGDAGTVTALEYCLNVDNLKFNLSTNGGMYKSIIIPDGGARNPFTSESLKEVKYGEGIIRTALDSEMDGMSVFAFGLKRAPESVNQLIDYYNIDKESIDLFLFHQANFFMNEKIRKKLKVPENKVPYSLKNYGNTSCATIPVTCASQCVKQINNNKLDLIACAFGVGLSWGSVNFTLDNIVCLPIIEY